MKIEYSIVIFILVVLLFLLMTSSCMNYVPYYRDSRYLKGYPFEGFTNKDSIKSGAAALQSSNFDSDQLLDKFSQVDGSPSCIGDSNGLYNSKGGLCLTNELKTLLQSRGGNASGNPDKFGQ